MEMNDLAKSKPLHDVLLVTFGMLSLQTQNKDVAIPYWRGAPGIAKTALAQAMCNAYDMNFIGTHYSLKPIEEISGLPIFYDITVNDKVMKGTQWTLPDILTEIINIAKNGKKTVWFLDDFHLAPPALTAIGYEMFTEWKLRGFEIPRNVAFLLAGNFSAKAGSKKNLTSAIANRCAIMPVHMDFEYWKEKYALPNSLNPKIITFLSNNKYRKYFQEEEQLDRPWASARSWTRFSNILSPMEEYLNKTSHQEILYYASAHIGEEAASEFTTYYKLFSEVKTSEIFDRLEPIRIPSNLTSQYIYILANVSEFINRYIKYTNEKDKGDKRNNIVEIMSDILIELGKQSSELSVTGMKEIVISEKSLKLKNIYSRIANVIQMKDPQMAIKLKTDIHQI